MTEKRALELPWSEVCKIVSDKINENLGISIQCKPCVVEGEFWEIAFQNCRLPIAKLCQLLCAVEASPEDWKCTIPDEVGDSVRGTGMVLAEKLLGRGLNLTWEHCLITEDSLWLVGVTETRVQADELTKAIRIIAECFFSGEQKEG